MYHQVHSLGFYSRASRFAKLQTKRETVFPHPEAVFYATYLECAVGFSRNKWNTGCSEPGDMILNLLDVVGSFRSFRFAFFGI